MNEQHIFSKYGGTRFLTTIGCGLVSAILLLLGSLTGDQFVEITKWTVSVFIGSHAGQNIIGFLSNRRTDPAANSEGESNANRQN